MWQLNPLQAFMLPSSVFILFECSGRCWELCVAQALHIFPHRAGDFIWLCEQQWHTNADLFCVWLLLRCIVALVRRLLICSVRMQLVRFGCSCVVCAETLQVSVCTHSGRSTFAWLSASSTCSVTGLCASHWWLSVQGLPALVASYAQPTSSKRARGIGWFVAGLSAASLTAAFA